MQVQQLSQVYAMDYLKSTKNQQQSQHNSKKPSLSKPKDSTKRSGTTGGTHGGAIDSNGNNVQ